MSDHIVAQARKAKPPPQHQHSYPSPFLPRLFRQPLASGVRCPPTCLLLLPNKPTKKPNTTRRSRMRNGPPALSLDKHDGGIEVSFYGLRRRNDYHKGTGRVRSLKAAILLCRIHTKWATNSWIAQFEFVGRSIDFPFSSKRMFLQELKNNIGPPLPMSYREEAALE